MSRNFFKLISVFLLASFLYAGFCLAAGYQLLDSSFAPGGYATSPHFQLSGAISQITIGQSLSSNYKVNAGLLYFPTITTPTITATPGDAQVALTWTAAEGVLGWTVGSYEVGQAVASGGPYNFSSAGLSTNATKTGLTNGTNYYFVVRVKDAYSNPISTSTEVLAKPVATVVTPPGGGGGGSGGGGGGGTTPTETGTNKVIFRGRAYPLSSVTLLRDGVVVATTKSGPDANFEISLTGLSTGSYNFSVYAVDSSGNQSLAQTFPVTLTTGAGATISGIFIAPSILVDKEEVKKGDNIAIFGQSVPASEVVIAINSEKEIFAKASTDKDGAYLYNLDTVELEMGSHTAKSKASKSGAISPFGPSIGFRVGTQNIAAVNTKIKPKPKTCPAKGDLNGDCKVNLVDFSIAAYWYKRQLTGAVIQNEKDKLNGDNKITLTDFSIIAYYWSG